MCVQARLVLGERPGILDVGVDAELRQPAHRRPARLVIPKRGEELAAPGEQRQLARDDRAAARRLAPDLGRVDDRAGLGPVLHTGEFDPLDMTDDSASHSPAASHV